MRAQVLARDACQLDPPEGLHQIQSAAFQKDRARIKAFEEWAQDWQRAHTERETGLKPPSFAYTSGKLDFTFLCFFVLFGAFL